MQGRRSQTGVDADAKSAQVMGPLSPPDVEPKPPHEAAAKPWHSRQADLLPKRTHVEYGCDLEMSQPFVQFNKFDLGRRLDVSKKNAFLAVKLPFDGDGSHGRGMLVQVSPWPAQIGAAQLRHAFRYH